MNATRSPRVLVVGSGGAGLTTALEACARGHEVVLAAKDALDATNTVRAQGGMAAMTAGLPGGQPRDRAELHVADTLAAGAGLCEEPAVRALVAGSAAAVADLERWGVAFDRTAGPGSPWVEGLEGAHSVPRILHAGGDATGREIQRALLAAALGAERAGRLEILRHTLLVDLLRGPGDAPVTGALVLGPDGLLRTVAADAVVLATGGAGQLYPHTTNAPGATGDGIAAALRAGAVVADLEFVQFHPTALAAPGCFLVTEAVRGEGAVLRDAGGRRFLRDAHPRAELAPRDVVAREIVRRCLAQGGRPVVLDATGLGRQFLAARFPTVDAALRAHGLDWSREPVPVTPAAHYLMGGIATDPDGRTTVPGLWAVGECAATGVHGANRLASNSLLEGVVLGARVAAALGHDRGPFVPRGPVRPLPAAPSTGTAAPAAPGASDDDGVPLRSALQEAMWAGAGVLRDGPGLAALAGRLGTLRAPAGTDRRSVEDRGLLELARAVTAAATARTESRGAHAREDHPHPDPALATRTFWCAERHVPVLTSAHASDDMHERIPAC